MAPADMAQESSLQSAGVAFKIRHTGREGAACAFIIFRTNRLFLDEIRFEPLPSKFAQQSSMSDAIANFAGHPLHHRGQN